MATIDEQLDRAQARQQLIAVYNFVDEGTFSVGYVLQQDETHVLLKVIDPNGSINGLQLISKAFIDRVVMRSDYLRSSEVWQHVAETNGYADPWHLATTQQRLTLTPTKLMTSLLRDALQQKLIVNLGTIRQLEDDEVEDASFTGFVGDYVGEAVALNYLDPWNLTDAWQIDIEVSAISYVRVGAGECVKMQALMEQYTDETF
ncbi:hypothetical protein ACRYI5_00455 [Furfurilactobacillus sp. WILCCON 0119]